MGLERWSSRCDSASTRTRPRSTRIRSPSPLRLALKPAVEQWLTGESMDTDDPKRPGSSHPRPGGRNPFVSYGWLSVYYREARRVRGFTRKTRPSAGNFFAIVFCAHLPRTTASVSGRSMPFPKTCVHRCSTGFKHGRPAEPKERRSRRPMRAEADAPETVSNRRGARAARAEQRPTCRYFRHIAANT